MLGNPTSLGAPCGTDVLLLDAHVKSEAMKIICNLFQALDCPSLWPLRL